MKVISSSELKIFINTFCGTPFTSIEEYAKVGGPEVVWHLCSFTKILCGRNFCVW